MTTGNWITLGILIVAICTLLYTIYQTRKQSGANIIFKLNKRDNSDFYEFKIENKGNQDAKDFSFLINGVKPHNYDHFLFDLEGLNTIQAGTEHAKRISGPRESHSVITVTGSYNDKRGEQEINQMLNF